MPDASTFLQMMSIVHGCAFGYYVEDPGIDKTAVPPPGTTGAIAAYQNANKIKAYLVKNPQSFMTDQRPSLPCKARPTIRRSRLPRTATSSSASEKR
jgi:hypothetical protein